ncbi:alpha-1,4 glucan phosphorylase L-2 isozyme, chloroplastic/amyloplastic [Tanacetum coccineum]|uniref:Alpha-1,4 glucan phosphorylase n=1 Tax=Tanacetum coccineum TaxID=301880 RepID=A0ABQ5DVE2_9ASTR
MSKNLFVVGGHVVNGVAENVLNDFYKLWPDKFQNKTDRVTLREWISYCNPDLRKIVTEWTGGARFRSVRHETLLMQKSVTPLQPNKSRTSNEVHDVTNIPDKATNTLTIVNDIKSIQIQSINQIGSSGNSERHKTLDEGAARKKIQLDHILLETTWLANPTSLTSLLWSDNQPEASVKLDSIITVREMLRRYLSAYRFVIHGQPITETLSSSGTSGGKPKLTQSIAEDQDRQAFVYNMIVPIFCEEIYVHSLWFTSSDSPRQLLQ